MGKGRTGTVKRTCSTGTGIVMHSALQITEREENREEKKKHHTL